MADAAVVIAVLMVILVTAVTVQVRARRRRTRLAEMMRAIVPAPIPVPIPRSAVSSVTTTLEAPIAATPSPASPPSSLRGNDYSRGEREARFSAFDERSSTREAAPGRPARRLAA